MYVSKITWIFCVEISTQNIQIILQVKAKNQKS